MNRSNRSRENPSTDAITALIICRLPAGAMLSAAAILVAVIVPSSPLVRRRRSTEIVQYAAELVWRSTRMLAEEACEIALRAEAERIRNDADPVILLVQAADGRFDTQRVEIEPRAEADAGAEQVVEMRAREAGDACHAVEIERTADAVAHVAQRAA